MKVTLKVAVLIAVGSVVYAVQACSNEQDECPLRPIGERTFDFGVVEEGTVQKAKLRYRNQGQTAVRPDLANSCGCAKATVDPKVVEPGQEGVLSVDIDTLGRGGGMHEFIELRVPERGKLTFWLVGQVRPTVLLAAEPSVIWLGDVESQTTHSHKITVTSATSGKREALQFTCDDASTQLPISWDVKWLPQNRRSNPDENKLFLDEWTALITVSANRLGDTVDTPGNGSTMLAQLKMTTIDKSGKARAVLRIPILGRVVGPVVATPSSIYLGTLSPSEQIAFSVLVKAPGPAERPRVIPSIPEIALEGAEISSTGHVLSFKLTSPVRSRRRTLSERIDVEFSTGKVTIPIIGWLRASPE